MGGILFGVLVVVAKARCRRDMALRFVRTSQWQGGTGAETGGTNGMPLGWRMGGSPCTAISRTF